jgi:hypothetical protein
MTLLGKSARAICLGLFCLGSQFTAHASDIRSDLQSWLLEDSKGWVSTYVHDSIRSITVIDSSRDAIILSARYDFRIGDSTFSDTAYFAFSDGRLFCLAYKFDGETSTTYGKQRQ